MPKAQTKSRCSSETRQAEIVDAVLSLAAQRSPLLITTADIAKVMGLTQGAVFKHFPTKDAIALAVMAWVDTHLHETLESAARQAPDALAGLRAVFVAHVRFVARHPGVPRLIFSELQQPNDTLVKVQVRNLLMRYRKLLMSLLTTAEQSGQLGKGVDKSAAASLFIGTIQGLVMQAMLAGACDRMEVEGKQALALYLRAIGVGT